MAARVQNTASDEGSQALVREVLNIPQSEFQLAIDANVADFTTQHAEFLCRLAGITKRQSGPQLREAMEEVLDLPTVVAKAFSAMVVDCFTAGRPRMRSMSTGQTLQPAVARFV